jgi:hypothetical protein
MNRSKFHVLGIIMLVLVAGCSSNVQPPTTPPQVNYVQGTTYVYYAQNLDKSSGQPVAGSGDTITSVVLQTGISYQGKTNVTEIQNTHSNAGTGVASMDTTYISQTNGEYWHYNFGLELLNSNTTVLGYANSGNQINGGWVLQSKLAANVGDTWIGMDTTLTLKIGTAPLIDSVNEMNDTTLSTGTAKHTSHSIKLNAVVVNAKIDVESYISTANGPLLVKFPPDSLAGSATPGRITTFVRVK